MPTVDIFSSVLIHGIQYHITNSSISSLILSLIIIPMAHNGELVATTLESQMPSVIILLVILKIKNKFKSNIDHPSISTTVDNTFIDGVSFSFSYRWYNKPLPMANVPSIMAVDNSQFFCCVLSMLHSMLRVFFPCLYIYRN